METPISEKQSCAFAQKGGNYMRNIKDKRSKVAVKLSFFSAEAAQVYPAFVTTNGHIVDSRNNNLFCPV